VYARKCLNIIYLDIILFLRALFLWL